MTAEHIGPVLLRLVQERDARRQVRELDRVANASHAVRRQEIIVFSREHPTLTLEAVGAHFDLTRERVRQIWQKEGYVSLREWRTLWHCKAEGCTTQWRGGSNSLYCLEHRGKKYLRGKPINVLINVMCGGCGEKFDYQASDLKSRQYLY